MADLCQELLPVSRNADAAVAGLRVWPAFRPDRSPRPANADEYYEIISKKLQTPEFLPRALFDRFNIEVLATTDDAVDSLEFHQAIRASGWKGRVLPTFRPDAVVDAEFMGFQDNLKKLGEVSGEDVLPGRAIWRRCVRGGHFSRRMARRRLTMGT